MPYDPLNPWMNFGLEPKPPMPLAPNTQEAVNEQNLMAEEELGYLPTYSSSSSSVKAGPDLTSINALLSEIDKKSKPFKDEQVDVIERLKGLRDRMPMEPGGVDLTGLMQLADAWNPQSGKLFTGSYKAPEGATERISRISQLNKAIADQAGNLNEEELNVLKTKLSGEIAKLHYGQARADKAEEKHQVDLEKDVQRLEKRIGDSVPAIQYKMDTLDSILNRLPKDAEGNMSIPGTGPYMKYVPDFMLSKDGKDIRQLANGLVRDLVKLQSGVAISPGEAEAKMAEMGLGVTSTSDQFIQGLTNLRAQSIQAIKKNEAAFRPEVVETFRDRGGPSSEGLVKKEPAKKMAGGFEIGKAYKNNKDGKFYVKTGPGSNDWKLQ